jgi:urea transport system ATP-binding protein
MLNVEELQVYYGDSQILDSISLNVRPNQVVCLLGRNGVGKTTLMKTIMGVNKPRKGKIILDGEDLTFYQPNQRAWAGVGYVPQGRGIFPYLTVYENLLMGFEASGKYKFDPDALDEMYQLFPVLKEMRQRVAGTLSGGQQQQLAIARALVRCPKLLLLDEPTEGIQPSIMLEIEEVILSLQAHKNISILVVEQFLDFALGVADYFYIMETGTIVEKGSIEHFNDEIAKTYLSV